MNYNGIITISDLCKIALIVHPNFCTSITPGILKKATRMCLSYFKWK